MPAHVRKDDLVMVIAGGDKGRTGKVLRVMPAEGKVIVDGVNVHRKAVRPSQQNQQGGVVERELTTPDGRRIRVRVHSSDADSWEEISPQSALDWTLYKKRRRSKNR